MLAESFADVLAINWERASVLGFPGGSDGKGSACNVGDLVRSLGREDPLQNGMATHPCILAWEFHGQRRLMGYCPWGHKGSNTTEQLLPFSFC